ncbi:MAG: 4-alpha-glucanotransferase [Chloroflexi bacterium]|nr:4-alpha-glucanotransferase [Chloroflexota bacterium]
MNYKRASGILLHPTSLPGPDGIGDFGPEAYRWIDFLVQSRTGLWQMLPLGPTGYGDSPYQCFSAFAGNPLLINPARLMEDGLLTKRDLAGRPEFAAEEVDYAAAIQWKSTLLDRAFKHFHNGADVDLEQAFAEFKAKNEDWLENFSLYMAIKATQKMMAWNQWPVKLRKREPQALQAFREANAEAIERVKFQQFLFFRQWEALRTYANQRNIYIIGDIPIFIAFDSADVWANPGLFYVDEEGQPIVVAGVPPDYFSATGQLWGNPLYRWEVHKAEGYQWWIRRIRSALQIFDFLRLDHFRGFAGYWEIPAGMPTAEVGRWAPGPGADFFEAILRALGSLPIIAEDLGEITPDVIELRDRFELPGMKIFQFAFSTDADDPFLPHNYVPNCVAYTGTHDNDTALGWYRSAPESERDFCRRYLARSGEDISWDMIRAVWSSVAGMALAPMQDVLSLGNEARMNYPGDPSGNWNWRMAPWALNDGLCARLLETNTLYSRLNDPPDSPDGQAAG